MAILQTSDTAVTQEIKLGSLPAEPSLLHSVQILRFIAAFMVVLFHARIAHVAALRSPDVMIDRVYELGAAGVHLFFLISGFVMVLTALSKDQPMRSVAFLRRRLTRIFPIYWVLALAYLAIYSLIGAPYDLSLDQIIGALLLIPSYSSKIIGPGWTLAYELYFYFCFAIALLFRPKLAIILLPAFFVSSIILSMLSPGVRLIMGIAGDALLLEFLAGAAVGLAYLRGIRLPTWTGLPLVAVGVIGLLIGLPFNHKDLPSILVWGAPCFPILVGMIAIEHRLRGQVATLLATLGNSSYFLYLVHILVIHLVFLVFPSSLFGRPVDIFIIPFAIALLCVLIAQFGHEIVERPLIKFTAAVMRRLTFATRAAGEKGAS